MRKFLKRFFQILFILLLLLFAGGVITVTLFEDEVVEAFTKKVNRHLNAEVKATDIDLTFLAHFPDLALELKNPLIYDAIEGSKDTLLSAQGAYFAFNPLELISGDYTVKACYLEHGVVKLKVDEQGYPNYNIVKPDTLSVNQSPVTFALEEVGLKDIRLVYINQEIENNHWAHLQEVEASLAVDSAQVAIALTGDLKLHHLGFGELRLFENKQVQLDNRMVFHQAESRLEIAPSQLVLSVALFDVSGNVGTGAEGLLDVQVKAAKGNAQTLISLLPEGFRAELAPYRSKGSVYFIARLQGGLSEGKAPQIDVDFGFENASFFHPETGRSLNGAYLTGKYTNGEKQRASSSVLSLKGIKASLEGNPFEADFELRNFDNPYLKLRLNGNFDVKSVFDLANFEALKIRKGSLTVKDVEVEGYLKHLQNSETLHRISSKGQIGLRQLDFDIPGNTLGFRDFHGEFLFNKSDLGITDLHGKVGNSDFRVTGFFKNFVSYALQRSDRLQIQGDFKSSYLDLDEMLQAQGGPSEDPEAHNYSFTLSPNFACDVDCHIERLKFRSLKGDLAGKHLSASVSVKNQVISYSRLSFGIAGGTLQMKGRVDARKPNNIQVQNYGRIDQIQVDQAFVVMENFGQDFLTDRHIKGTLHAKFYNELTFNEQLELDLPALKTSVDELIIDQGQLVNFDPMMEMGDWLVDKKLKRYLKKDDFSVIKFSKLTNQIFIEDEKVIIPEMTIETDAASDLTIAGTHTFEQEMSYALNFPLVNYKREARHEKLGIQKRDGKKHLYIYLNIVGTTDDYEIISDSKQIFESGKEKLADDIKQTFQPIDEPDNYYGLDTEDTTELLDMW